MKRQRWCETAIQKSPIILAACDRELRYVWLHNPDPRFRVESALGRMDADLAPSENVAELVALKREVLATGRDVRREISIRVLDELRHYDVTAQPILSPSGEVVGVTTAAMDVTELRRVERERNEALAREQAGREAVERALAEVERLTESRARLVRGLSHDVKNPLGAALGYAELLLSGIPDGIGESARGAVEGIRRSIGFAIGLVEELLELLQAETGQLPIRLERVDVGSAVREIVEEHRPQAEAAALTVQIEIPPDPPEVETDPRRLRQILGNLLSNSIKFTERGVVVVALEVRERPGWDEQGPWVAVHVRDTGPGVPEDMHERIFEEFTRVAGTAAPGSGVGLAVSRTIARVIGGDITLVSRTGVGSTFTLWLPPTAGPRNLPKAVRAKQDDKAQNRETRRRRPSRS